MSRALIAKQKIKVGMMLRLQGAPGDLLLSHEHKTGPGIMVTVHKDRMKKTVYE